jgi:chorismate--pyruvate lyase
MRNLPRWQAQLIANRPARPLSDWLREPDSLTTRCLRHCRSFRVQVLRQEVARPLADEAGRCRLPVREVLLECDGVPVIFAHSVLSTARGGRLGRWFGRLGNRSLGSLLFTHAGFRRGAIEFMRLHRQHPLYRRLIDCAVIADNAAGVEPALWARRSRHQLGQGSVLVTEVFLPAIEQLNALDSHQ